MKATLKVFVGLRFSHCADELSQYLVITLGLFDLNYHTTLTMQSISFNIGVIYCESLAPLSTI